MKNWDCMCVDEIGLANIGLEKGNDSSKKMNMVEIITIVLVKGNGGIQFKFFVSF